MLIIFLFVAVKVAAQTDQFTKVMTENIEKMKQAGDVSSFKQVANQFERIANVEKGEWLPSYYTAYCYIVMGFLDQDKSKMDQYLDKAQTFIDKATEISDPESELMVLQGLLYQARIQVDPMGRGMEYSQKANVVFEKAKAINPDNPRIYLLIGQSIYHTPEQYGGGPEKAQPYIDRAREKFDEYQPDSSLAPDWGREMLQNL